MKLKLVGLFCCLLLGLGTATPVYGQATITNFTNPFSEEFADTSPCTGEPVTINITGEAHTQLVKDSSGNVHGTFKLWAILTETNKVTGEVAAGSVIWIESFGPGRSTFVVTGTIVHPGPRNNVIVHSVFHLSPNGMLFDSAEADQCR